MPNRQDRCVNTYTRLGLLLLVSASVQPALAARYGTSSGKTDFSYRVTVVNVKGHSDALAATATFDPADVSKATGNVSIAAASLKTGNGLQEGHMRGALGADRFPNIVFDLGGVTGGGQLTEGQTLSTSGTGKLTLKGVTRPITVPLKLTMNGGKVAVATQFKFNPHDYGVDYVGGADSIALDVAFVLAPR